MPAVGVALWEREPRALAAKATQAEALGYASVTVGDHLHPRAIAPLTAAAIIATATERVRFGPLVLNNDFRHPVVLAREAAALAELSGGRFELGLGGGSFWDAIAAMGGPRRSPGENLEALAEAIAIIRLFWSGERSISFSGRHYTVSGLHPGPAPAHEIGIWLGVLKPRMLELTGRVADGWVPSI